MLVKPALMKDEHIILHCPQWRMMVLLFFQETLHRTESNRKSRKTIRLSGQIQPEGNK